MKRKIIIVSGPSCVGKTPLLDAVEKIYSDFKFMRPVLYTSRKPRPHEIDGQHYHFRDAEMIQKMPQDRFVVAKTRQNWQAVDVRELCVSDKRVILDTHPAIIQALQIHPLCVESGCEFVKIFLQPCTFQEIYQVADEMQCSSQQALAAMQTPHLIARAIKQGTELLYPVMSDINVRVNAAWQELLIGQDFDYLLINHDGEDSDHWHDVPPSGEAGETLEKFIEILRNLY